MPSRGLLQKPANPARYFIGGAAAAAVLGALAAFPASARAEFPDTIVYPFQGGNQNTVGADPIGQLVQGSDGSFYGVTQITTESSLDYGGAVYKVNPAGNITVLYNFANSSIVGPPSQPSAIVLGNDGNIYGTTVGGGNSDLKDGPTYSLGTIFKLTPSGSLTILHNFHPADGSQPYYGITQGPDGALYGVGDSAGETTENGGGELWRCSTHGVFSVLHTFAGFGDSPDGSGPAGRPLFGADGRIYGVTEVGGENGIGALYGMNADGSGETLLHSFGDPSVSAGDGNHPEGVLVQDASGALYGETLNGGPGNGTVYKINTDGSGYTVLHNFGDGSVKNDGESPSGGLTFGGDGNLYGVCPYGGPASSFNSGIAFRVTPSGDYKILHSFEYSGDVLNPFDPLIQGNDGNLYGVASYYASGDDNALYKLDIGLNRTPGSVASLTLNKTSATGGDEHVDGKITLVSPAGPGGARIKLHASNADKAVIDPYAYVPEGHTIANFRITTRPVSAPLLENITVSANGTSATQPLTITSGVPLASLTTLDPIVVGGVVNSTLTITLASPAPAGGETVSVTTTDNNAASVPVTVDVPAGATTATFLATTSPVSELTRQVTITANSDGVAKSVMLTVTGGS